MGACAIDTCTLVFVSETGIHIVFANSLVETSNRHQHEDYAKDPEIYGPLYLEGIECDCNK